MNPINPLTQETPVISNLERAAEVMAAVFHAAEVGGPLYTDAENPREAVLDATYDLHLVARALEDEGLLADDLPEPSFYAHGNQDKPMWDIGNYFRTDALDAPQVALSKAGNVWKMTPDEARALALALLAAAAHAQKDNRNE